MEYPAVRVRDDEPLELYRIALVILLVLDRAGHDHRFVPARGHDSRRSDGDDPQDLDGTEMLLYFRSRLGGNQLLQRLKVAGLEGFPELNNSFVIHRLCR